MQLAGAHRAVVLIGRQRVVAAGAAWGFVFVAVFRHAVAQQMQLRLPLRQQPQRLGVDVQRVAPLRQPLAGVAQLQIDHAGMVVVAQLQRGAQRPGARRVAGLAPAQQAAVGQRNQTMGKTQLGVEIQLQPAQQVFTGGKLAAHGRQPDVWQIRAGGQGKGVGVHVRAASANSAGFWRNAQKPWPRTKRPGPTGHRRVGAMQGCREV